MARYAGRKGMVYLAVDGSSAAVLVAQLSSWSMNRSTDKLDATVFQDTNKVYVQGLPDLRGNFDGIWSDADTTVFQAAGSSAAVRMYLYPSSDAPSKYAYGLAWLDASIDCSVTDTVKINGEYVAGGSWTISF